MDYIRENKQVKVVDLVRFFGISNVAVHKQLNKLIQKGQLIKAGKPPLVFYSLREKETVIENKIPQDIEEFLDKNYIYVSPAGEYLAGTGGFIRWVYSIKQENYLLPLANEYVKVRNDANKYITSYGWIDATQAKEVSTFGDTIVDHMLYKDFYSIEKFGKTKLGQMVLYSKMSQNTNMIDHVVNLVEPTVSQILKKYEIDTIAYIPPSIKRKVQFMAELKKRLHIDLPEIYLVKAYLGDVIVAQKSLSKFQERVLNAQQTIFVDMSKSAKNSKNVLIIDDAVGSGATIHETAKKIRELLNPTGNIISFAIVGSIKGFEVIREI